MWFRRATSDVGELISAYTNGGLDRYRFHFQSAANHFNVPESCAKTCVNAAMVRPDARAVASSTDETLAPTPAPAAAPHTRNTYRNEVRHSDEVELRGEEKKKTHNIS